MKENQPWKFQICSTRSPHFVGMSLKLALSPANLCRRYGTFSSHNMPNACNMRICIRFPNFLDSEILQHRSGHRRSSNREDFYHDYCHQPERWVGRYSYTRQGARLTLKKSLPSASGSGNLTNHTHTIIDHN